MATMHRSAASNMLNRNQNSWSIRTQPEHLLPKSRTLCHSPCVGRRCAARRKNARPTNPQFYRPKPWPNSRPRIIWLRATSIHKMLRGSRLANGASERDRRSPRPRPPGRGPRPRIIWPPRKEGRGRGVGSLPRIPLKKLDSEKQMQGNANRSTVSRPFRSVPAASACGSTNSDFVKHCAFPRGGPRRSLAKRGLRAI